MNEDYLWDKSGEPDPQIQQLEEILGTLRYQPRPLPLAPRRHYFPLLAIAAALVVALLTGGLWLLLQNPDASIPSVAIETAPPTKLTSDPFFSVSPSPVSPRRRPTLPAKHNNPEAVAAKQQLMYALRIASEKLNAAYRRTQSPTQIKNQHRAG